MSKDLDEQTRQEVEARAHQIWLEEGKPEGKADEHWHRALQDISVIAKKPPRKVAKNPKASLADAVAPGGISPRAKTKGEAIPTAAAKSKTAKAKAAKTSGSTKAKTAKSAKAD